MKLHLHKANERRGAALISSLMLVAAVASMGAGLVQISSISTRKQNQSIDTTRSLYIAEAGMSEAYFAVAQGRSGQLGSSTEPVQYGGGYYWVESTELAGNRIELEATGLVGRGKFTLGLVLNRSINQVAAMGFCGLKDVTIGGASQIGSVTPLATAGSAAKVRSNGDITIYGGGGPYTTIQGDVHAGPDGLIDMDPGVVVTGEAKPASRGLTMPGFTIPRLGGSPDLFSYPSHKSHVILTGEEHFEAVEVPPGQTLELQGPIRLRADHLVIGAGGTLIIDTTGGPVGIYTTLTTVFDFGSNLINVGADPTQCSIFALTPVEGDRSLVSMAGKGEFYGMLVAPRSYVDIPGDLTVIGSVVAEHLNIGSGAQLTFAESLRNGGYGVKMTPTLVSWQILEVPNVPLTSGSKSVDDRLTALGYTPLIPNTAPVETNVSLKYFDLVGVLTVYDGAIAGVPWTNVESVDSLGWYDAVNVLQPDQRPSVVIDAVDDNNGTVDLIVDPQG